MVRGRGSKVTGPPLTRAGSPAWNSGSTRTVPVNQASGPLPEGREPLRLRSIAFFLLVGSLKGGVSARPERVATARATAPAPAISLLRVAMGPVAPILRRSE